MHANYREAFSSHILSMFADQLVYFVDVQDNNKLKFFDLSAKTIGVVRGATVQSIHASSMVVDEFHFYFSNYHIQ